MSWTLDQIPNLTERVALVTGANSGIGYETALILAQNASYWGPSGFLGLRGSPIKLKIPERALDLATTGRLWTVSEELTGLSIPIELQEGSTNG